MAWYGNDGGWGPYVSAATKVARGHAAAAKRAKSEGREPAPITIEGRKIAKTFWGLKWYENLNRYRDIANRLDRGATYVRNGSVADLVIESGKVRAIVGGSEAYQVQIDIKTLKPDVWQAIRQDCSREVESLLDLLQGRFNEGVMKRLTQAEGGLFPHKNEISMSCSCPDYASVCKHLAAVFYGIAARLDQQPELLFKLRNVNHLDLIKEAANANSLDEALGTSMPSQIADSDLSSIFGIELESSEVLPSATASSNTKRRATPRSISAVTKKPTKKKVVVNFASKSTAKRKSPLTPVADPKVTGKSTSSVGVKKKRAKKVPATKVKAAEVAQPTKKALKAKAVRKSVKRVPVAKGQPKSRKTR